MTTSLYTCRDDGDQYRITKLDADLNPESSYLVTLDECECPAGVRPSCRHRQMLPKFIQRGAVNTHWLYDFDGNGWVQGPELSDDEVEAIEAEADEANDATLAEPEPTSDDIAQQVFARLAEIPGVTIVSLANPETLHNTIADALGEPRLPAKPFRRGF